MEMLRNGSRGDTVVTLQKQLFGKGINPGAADGIFGPKTEEAVRRYQEQHGLQVDGIAGPETFTALGMMKAESPEPVAAAAPQEESSRTDGFKAKSRVIGPADQKEDPAPATPSGIDAMRGAERATEARADDEAESAVEAMTGAMKEVGEKAEAETPKRGFLAKIQAMRDARKAKGAS